jgi:hypothetical protein
MKQAASIEHIGDDDVNGKWVSTVWLGIDHNYFGGTPLLFETMVFENRESGIDLYCERHSSWGAAKEGHKKAVQWAKDKEKRDE